MAIDTTRGAAATGNPRAGTASSNEGPPTVPGAPARVAIALIRGYQVAISPGLPPRCRFTPSCSQYTLEAVRRYGAARGVWLGIKRLVRCHPFNPGGFDPVP